MKSFFVFVLQFFLIYTVTKWFSRAIFIQRARVYLATIMTEKNVEVRRLSRAYPKVS